MYYSKSPHQFRGGDIVVLPDNDQTGHQIGIVCWVSTDKREIIVRDTQYNTYNDIEQEDWRYTGLTMRRLQWLAYWGTEYKKQQEQKEG